MTNPLSAIRRALEINLSQLENSLASRRARLAIRYLRIIIHVGRMLLGGKHGERAAALTYFSLLALVPLLAVVFSLFKAFGGMSHAEDQVKSFLFGYLADEGQGQVSVWLDTFVKSFHAGAVGGIGMAALFVTLILTIGTVEDALNQTWAVHKSRGWGMRLVVYWSLLTIGPVLLGSSLAMTASLESTSAVAWARAHIPLFAFLRRLVPILFTSLAFAAMYLILPAARVRWRAALAGGVVAGVIFELAKSLYAMYVARGVASYPLYGSLAALPFFFIWINYSWRIVLFGADIAHALQYLSTDPTEETDPRTNQATREESAVRICAVIASAFAANRPPPSRFSLSAQLLLPAHLSEVLCRHLLASGLVREIASDRREPGLVPARPLADLSAADVVRVLRHNVGFAHWAISGNANDVIEEVLAKAEAQSMAVLDEMKWTDMAGLSKRELGPAHPIIPVGDTGGDGAEKSLPR